MKNFNDLILISLFICALIPSFFGHPADENAIEKVSNEVDPKSNDANQYNQPIKNCGKLECPIDTASCIRTRSTSDDLKNITLRFVCSSINGTILAETKDVKANEYPYIDIDSVEINSKSSNGFSFTDLFGWQDNEVDVDIIPGESWFDLNPILTLLRRTP